MATALVTSPSPDAELSPTIGLCAERGTLRDRIGATLVAGGLDATHQSADLTELSAVSEETPVDLAVIAVGRPDGPILEGVRALGQAVPGIHIVMIFERAAVGDIRKSIDAGAQGVVLAEEIEDVLALVLHLVVAGQVSVPGGHGKEVRGRVLTTREKQILGLVVMGMTNAEIAAKLFLAESTIKSHLSSAFAKLGVTSRNEAAALILNPATGIGLGILTIPSEKISASR